MKKNYTKEKILYASLAVFIVLLSTISFSFAFKNDTKISNGNTPKDNTVDPSLNIDPESNYQVPVLNFKKTNTYHINGNNSYDKIDAILTSSLNGKTTCKYDIFFEFTGETPFITSDDNLINVTAYNEEEEILNINLSSVNRVNYEKIGEYSISGENGNTVTENLIFYVSSNNINNYYEGYIDLRNVICTND